MSYVPYPSGTLLVPSGSDKHLFIIVTKKCSGGCHLLLPIFSVKKDMHHDDACEFGGGEHDFIKHHSYVAYRFAEQKNAVSIGRMIDANYYIAKADLVTAHFTKVCNGIDISKFVKRWVITYFHDNAP